MDIMLDDVIINKLEKIAIREGKTTDEVVVKLVEEYLWGDEFSW